TPTETARTIANALYSKPEKYKLQQLNVYEGQFDSYIMTETGMEYRRIPLFTLQFEEDTPPTLDELTHFSGNHYSFVLEFLVKRDLSEGKMEDCHAELGIYGKDFTNKTTIFNVFNRGV